MINHLAVTDQTFEAVALELFRYQATCCAPYAEWVGLLGVDPQSVSKLSQIPFMPIEFFKSHRVYSSGREAELVFTSSGTTGSDTSSHLVPTAEEYRATFRAAFEHFYGSAADYSIFALLPSYMERTGSSLTYMVEDLHAHNPSCGGFYLYDHEKLINDIRAAHSAGERIILIGVSFALLDLAQMLSDRGDESLFGSCSELYEPIVIETGGMKGRRREISREELHASLCKAFGVGHIESEYGMTELLSQAYARGVGARFECPPWMRIRLRDLMNPLSCAPVARDGSTTGGIDIIDLANRYSCAFIATQDRGVIDAHHGGVAILGRIENSQLRGCNMLLNNE